MKGQLSLELDTPSASLSGSMPTYRRANVLSGPASICSALPPIPFSDVGGVDWPSLLYPQQTAAPVPAWIAQL